MREPFGRYQLLRKLATGGMGQIYLARHKGPAGFEKLVVVKRLLPHLAEDEDFIAMFFDEARIAALLDHPNIVQIHELGKVDGTYYMAMEYVHGDSLGAIGQRATAGNKPMPLALECRVIAEAACGLDFAHRSTHSNGEPLGLIHRDVSPQNVLVAFSGRVKLIDFGVAKVTGKISTTRAGAIKGKYAYMSPEQAHGEPLDQRSDVFGLGIVFHELLTGARLFRRESATATLKAVVGAKIPTPSSIAKGIPKAIDSIVLKALARDRTERFQTAGELQFALEEYLLRHRLAATPSHLAAYLRELYGEAGQAAYHHTPSKPKRSAGSPPIGSDLDHRLLAVRPTDTVHGLLFNAVLGAVAQHAGPAGAAKAREAAQDPRPYLDAKSYPTAEFLRVLWKAAELLAPVRSGFEQAFGELGAACMASLVRSPAGATLEGAGRAGPQGRVLPLLATLETLVTPADRSAASISARGANLLFKNELLPPAFYVGLIQKALLEPAGSQLSVNWEQPSATALKFKLAW